MCWLGLNAFAARALAPLGVKNSDDEDTPIASAKRVCLLQGFHKAGDSR
jgi:hypothetical protein